MPPEKKKAPFVLNGALKIKKLKGCLPSKFLTTFQFN